MIAFFYSNYAYEIKVDSLNFDKDKDLFYSFTGEIKDDIRTGKVAELVTNKTNGAKAFFVTYLQYYLIITNMHKLEKEFFLRLIFFIFLHY